jgi:MoaA/NifB/PqqE/SkfB family radical SAM enzyme
MYIQVTNRCNMSCEHCGMNCTAKGEDMSFDTFKACLKHDDHITIGGGEPTVHPQFEKFLFYALAHCESVFIITNGKLTDKALAIAKLNDMDSDGYTFAAELSQDTYHDPIDPQVVDAFGSCIRDTSDRPIMAGRCDWGDEDICICEEMFVLPNGDVHQCGCGDSPKVGTVFQDDELKPLGDEDSWEWICHKKVVEMA